MDHRLTRLSGIAELERALADSHDKPVLLFKHSHTCGISAEALDELRTHLGELSSLDAAMYAMVTVQTHRDVSNAIATRLGVRHETPQAILVKAGRVVWTASHFRVNAAELKQAIGSAGSSMNEPTTLRT